VGNKVHARSTKGSDCSLFKRSEKGQHGLRVQGMRQGTDRVSGLRKYGGGVGGHKHTQAEEG